MIPEFINKNILPLGTIIGGVYEVKAVVKQSPESVVYLASHRGLEKDVALKVLNLTDNARDGKRILRFRQEAKLASNLNHANVVRTLASGSLDDDRPYLVMEVIDGTTLREHLYKVGVLEPESFKEIFSQVLNGLEYVHESGLLHRDIKPDNILIAKREDGFVLVKLADFGIAKVMDESIGEQSLTATRDILGSPAYMSPEQCQYLKLDERSDIYSLGCVMYEALSGSPPFVAESSYDLMYKQLHEKPRLLSEVDKKIYPSLSLLVDRCLQKKSEDRWKSATELKSALESIKSAPAVSAGQIRLLLVGITLVLALAIATVTLVLNTKKGQVVSSVRLSTPGIKRKPETGFDPDEPFKKFEVVMNWEDCRAGLEQLTQLSNWKGLTDQAHLEQCYSYYYGVLRNYPLAIMHGRKAATLALKQESTKDDKAYVSSKTAEAQCLIKMRDYSTALPIIVELERKPANEQKQPTLGFVRCEYLFGVKEYDKLAAFCKAHLSERDLTVDERIRYRNYLALSMALQNKRKELKALTRMTGMDISRFPVLSALDYAAKSTFYQSAAAPYLLMQNWRAARPLLSEAATMYALFTADTITPLNAHLLPQMAVADVSLDDRIRAKSEFTQAMTIQELIGDRERLSSYLGLAYIAYMDSDQANASKFMKKALLLEPQEWKWCDSANQSVDLELSLASHLISEGDKVGARRLIQQANSLPFQSVEQKQRAKDLERESN